MPRSLAHLTGKELETQRKKERRSGLSAINAIRRYLYDPGKISLRDEDREILERYKVAWHQLCNGETTRSVVEKLQQLYGMSIETHYLDVRNCKIVFGDPKDINKKADAIIAGEIALDLVKKAKDAGEYAASASALGKFITARGLDRDDPDIPDVSKFDGHRIEISLPPEQVALLETLIKTNPVLNISDMMNQIAEDAIMDEEE